MAIESLLSWKSTTYLALFFIVLRRIELPLALEPDFYFKLDLRCL